MKAGIIDSLYAVAVSINCVYCIYMKFTDKLQTYSSFWVFFLQTFLIRRTAGERGAYSFNSSLPLPPASQTLR